MTSSLKQDEITKCFTSDTEYLNAMDSPYFILLTDDDMQKSSHQSKTAINYTDAPLFRAFRCIHEKNLWKLTIKELFYDKGTKSNIKDNCATHIRQVLGMNKTHGYNTHERKVILGERY
jgi:hypothetical protein